MAQKEPLSVVMKDKHSVNLYNAIGGRYIRNVFVTTGEIIGQPVISGDYCTVTCIEGGRTVVITYTLPQFKFRNKFYP